MKMSSNCEPLIAVVSVLMLAINYALISTCGAQGGITSSYRRKLDVTADMPLDADVFRPPPGYNAPQQATNYNSR
jgi:hypothetical protein